MTKKTKQQREVKKVRAARFDGLMEDGQYPKSYKGYDYLIVVKDGRLFYKEKQYRSLTAIAREITGYKAISGPAFFKVTKQPATA